MKRCLWLPALLLWSATALAEGQESCSLDYAGYVGGELTVGEKSTLNGTQLTEGTAQTSAMDSSGEVQDWEGEAPVFPPLDPEEFPGVSGAVTVVEKGSLSLDSPPYYLESLTVRERGALSVAPGDYFIDELRLEEKSSLVIEPQGSVSFYVGSSMELSEKSELNTAGDPEDFSLYFYDGVQADFSEKSGFKGGLYAPGSNTRLTVGEKADVSGGIFVAGDLELGAKVNLTYSDLPQLEASKLFCEAVYGPASESAALDHFAISHDGSAVFCQPERVTLQAHTADDGVFVDYEGTVELSTSSGRGSWSLAEGGGSLTPAGGGGARYRFDRSDNGTVVLTLQNTTEETLSINVQDTGRSESPSEDPSLSFARTGFSWLADGVPSAVGTQIAGKPSHTAPGAQTIRIQAVRSSDTTLACEGVLDGTFSLEVGGECLDPSSCSSVALSLSTDAGSTFTPVPLSAAGGSIAYSDVAGFDFSAGVAPVVLRYEDAGKIRLHVRYDLGAGGAMMEGQSNAFAVRPFGFDVQVTDNPAAVDADGAVFRAAGEAMEVVVRAVGWQSGDDLDGNGVPDGHDDSDPTNNADLADNAALPSFGRELSAEEVRLDARELLPDAETAPLSGTRMFGGFSLGSAVTGDLVYADAGILEITARLRDGDYLGIGSADTAGILGATGRVGRFVPHHFGLSVATGGALASPCGSFIYSGQDFGYTPAGRPALIIEAQSLAGTRVSNYTGSFARLSPFDVVIPPVISDSGNMGADGTSLLALSWIPGTPTLIDQGDGTLRFELGNDQLRYLRSSNARRSPVQTDLRLQVAEVTDLDSVSAAGVPVELRPAPLSLRYGRLWVQSVSGPETEPLTIPLQAQMFDGAAFVLNPLDGCTDYDAVSVVLSDFRDGLEAGDTHPQGAGTLANGEADPASPLQLGAPAGEQAGSVDLSLDAPPWLEEGGDPTATATFGTPPAPPGRPLIYTRERLE